MSPLGNTKNDAYDMANLLEKAGFRVDRQIDTNLSQLQTAVDRFGVAIRDPMVRFGVFYYAGHGLQQDWHNYLVPVSASIRNPSDIAQQTVDVSRLLQYMEQAVGRNFLVVLDACRDDPFEGVFRPAAKGLSQFDAPVGSLLAFSTAPGRVAADGEGKNGLYTGNLLREFAVPGARVEDAFKRVRLNVRLASKGAQIPWESTSLEEDISIFPVATHKLTEAERDKLLEKEMTAWLRIKGSNDPEVLAGFIREYPSGSASELALSRMNRMLAAMAAQESQRLQNVASNAVQRANELAAAEAAAHKLAVQAEEQRQAAAKAEAERLRVAQLEAEEHRARVQQAAAEAAAQAETARLAREMVVAAMQEAARLAAAKKEAEQQNELKVQAAAAEQERLQAQQQAGQAKEAHLERQRQAAAKAEVERLRAAQLEDEERRARVQQAAAEAAAQVETARLARVRALAAEQEATRLAAAKKEAERQNESKAQAAAAEHERLQSQQQQKAEEARLEQQRQAELRQRETAREAAVAALAQEQEARRLSELQQEQARQSELQAQAAAQLQRLAAMQAEKENRERDLAVRAQRYSEELAAQVAKQQLEVARFAAERQTLLETTQSIRASETLPSTPFFKGSNEHVRHFSVGDQATIEVIDELTKIAKRKVMKVTGADTQSDRITYNDGEYVSDLMGNTTVNQLGSFSTPRQFYPAELFVGNKWHTRFKQSRPNGLTYTFQYDLKVVGKEKITVPAGTFEAYKIEARGFNLELNASLERNIWVTPGINSDIAHETRVRLRNGNINQYDREELVSFVQAVR